MDQSTFSLYAARMRRSAEISARMAGCTGADAEDVASEVMVTLWMMRERLEESTCAAYARVTARHKALNALRGRDKNNLSIYNIADCPPPSLTVQSPEEKMISEEDISWFLDKVNSLPSTQQAILRLRQVDMLDKAEIAIRLGIPETSVATLLSRARRTMYNAIKERMKK